MNTARTAEIARRTAETDITLSLTIDGQGRADVSTGIGFFDHMLTLFAKHSLIDLKVVAKGDLHVDYHHTVEDIGIVMGQALRQALGDKKGLVRYGWAYLPMDETLARVAVDLSGRSYLEHRVGTDTRATTTTTRGGTSVAWWGSLSARGTLDAHPPCRVPPVCRSIRSCSICQSLWLWTGSD